MIFFTVHGINERFGFLLLYIHAGGFVFVCMAWYSYNMGTQCCCEVASYSYFTGNLRTSVYECIAGFFSSVAPCMHIQIAIHHHRSTQGILLHFKCMHTCSTISLKYKPVAMSAKSKLSLLPSVDNPIYYYSAQTSSVDN